MIVLDGAPRWMTLPRMTSVLSLTSSAQPMTHTPQPIIHLHPPSMSPSHLVSHLPPPCPFSSPSSPSPTPPCLNTFILSLPLSLSAPLSFSSSSFQHFISPPHWAPEKLLHGGLKPVPRSLNTWIQIPWILPTHVASVVKMG